MQAAIQDQTVKPQPMMASESSSTAQPPTSHPALRYASRGEHLTGDRGVVAAHSTTSLCLVRMCLRTTIQGEDTAGTIASSVWGLPPEWRF